MKRICSMILALVLVLSGCTSTVAAVDNNGANTSPVKAEWKFSDVSENAYYADAVQWAVERGVTVGTGENTFSHDKACTRAQIVTFLWRAAGSPAAAGKSRFADIPFDAYYADAVSWAKTAGITAGVGNNSFNPNAYCTRGQIVTFLHRDAQ